jgi:threonine dehydratase
MIGIEDIRAASDRIGTAARRTPVVALADTPLLVKCENLQWTGSFKIRGATSAIAALEPAGVVAASSGNHGRAVATAAAQRGIPATIVMTADSSAFKRTAIEALGAAVVECDPGTEARERTTEEVAAAGRLTVIPPYDHPLVMAGQGTVGLEIAEDVADLTTIVVPVGGGGLIAGCATAIKALRPDVRIIGAEPAAGDDTARSFAAGRRVAVPVPETICDGARVEIPGLLTFPVIARLVDEVVTATDDEVVAAVRCLARGGLAVEPTAALAVAVALRLGLGPGTVCVLTGRNIDPVALGRLLAGP